RGVPEAAFTRPARAPSGKRGHRASRHLLVQQGNIRRSDEWPAARSQLGAGTSGCRPLDRVGGSRSPAALPIAFDRSHRAVSAIWMPPDRWPAGFSVTIIALLPVLSRRQTPVESDEAARAG